MYYAKRLVFFSLVTCLFGFIEQSFGSSVRLWVSQPKEELTAAPFYLGISKGYFSEEDIDIEITELDYADGDAKIFSAMMAGHPPDLAIIPSTSALLQSEDKQFLKILSALLNGTDASIWTYDGVTNLDDLKGRAIAVRDGKMKPPEIFFMLAAMNAKGLQPSEVKLMPEKEEVLALRGRDVGAALIPRSLYFKAKAANLINFLELDTFLPSFPSYVLAGNRNWLQNNKETVLRVLKGQIKSQWFLNFNLGEAIRVLVKNFPIRDQKSIQDMLYYRVVNGLLPVTGMIDVYTFEKGTSLFRDYGFDIKSSGSELSYLIKETVDLTFLLEAKGNLCKKCWRLPSCPPK